MNRVFPWLWAGLVACGGGDGADSSATDDTTDTTEAANDPYAGLAAPTPPDAYSDGTCPALKAGKNTGFSSKGTERAFSLSLPKEPTGAGLLFLWHGNGDTGENFANYLNADKLAKQYNLVVIAPEKGSGGVAMDWGVPPSSPNADGTFFDDMLACAAEQYDLDLQRVYTAGFSAGALFSSWLTLHRADHLAAAVIFSGGSDVGFAQGGSGVNQYESPARPIPVLMTEGGPSDQVMINFEKLTNNMAKHLREDGSTVVVCPHTLGHTIPPGYDDYAWPFLDNQIFGQVASPYADGADPSGELPASCTWD